MKAPTTTYNGQRRNYCFDVTVDGKPLDPGPSQKLQNHSPDGFAWGYGGSGPAQLALAILLNYLGDGDRALKNHQEFKFRRVAWPARESWAITGAEIDLVINKIERDALL